MPFYKHHVFFCTNQREEGQPCCGKFDARKMRDHAKQRMKELGLHGPGETRINLAGCLGRCEHGPVLVVYPEEVWYTYVDREDIDEIIEQHLVKGEIVERLTLQ